MRLRHIEVFHAIYTSGSITNAAKLLHVSQPSVSKVLSHAEMQLGFQLFKRIKGRLIPTNEAALLFEEVDKIYQQLNTIKDSAENIKNKEIGRISLAISPALGFDVLPKAVGEFRQQHSEVTFDIKTLHNDQLQKHLIRHNSEMAIMFAPEKISGLEQMIFGEGEIVAVYPKKLIPEQPKVISLEKLLEFPLVSIWDSGPLADLVWKQLKLKNLKAKDVVKVQTYFIAVNLVKHGVGVCLVDEFTAKSQESELLAIAKLENPIHYPIKGLYLEKRPLSHATQDFIESFKKALLN